jgi:hypothetical protein
VSELKIPGRIIKIPGKVIESVYRLVRYDQPEQSSSQVRKQRILDSSNRLHNDTLSYEQYRDIADVLSQDALEATLRIEKLEAELATFHRCGEVTAVCMDEEGRIHYANGAVLYAEDAEDGDVPIEVFHKHV